MELLDALEESKIPYLNSHTAEGEIFLCCPFCVEEGEESNDSRFRLGVNFKTGMMHCFNCGKKSADPEFISVELERALELGTLAEAGKQGKKKEYKDQGPVKLPVDFVKLTKRIEKEDDYWGAKAWRYLHSRGVTPRQAKENKIGYCLADKKYGYRLVFPVYYKDKLKGLVCRDFSGRSRLKYKNSTGPKYLYIAQPVVGGTSIVLSEGVLDALAIKRGMGKSSQKDSGAVLGHVLTDEQLKQIRKAKYREVIIWFDPDKAGVEGLAKVWGQLKTLKAVKSVKVVLPLTLLDEEDYDPSDALGEEAKIRVKNAKEVSEPLIQRIKLSLLKLEDD